MKKIFRTGIVSTMTAALIGGFSLIGCSSDGGGHAAAAGPVEEETVVAVPVDYTLGNAMNKRLGKGINLGNSWDSKGYDDGGWGNYIEDTDFALLKAAGFNSIRLPVRWDFDSDYATHTVSEARLAGVKEDIQLAISQDLAVIVNFHHYETIHDLCGAKYRGKADSTALYEAEKQHFLLLWNQVSKELNVFPDNMVVFEILNEPACPDAQEVSDIQNAAFNIIRANAPGKTVMFEAMHLGKFEDIDKLKLPLDGNIIFSGHYYEPYGFSHQGHSYPCKGDAAYGNTAAADLKKYVAQVQKLYPGTDGGHVPMNMGEFGISGGESANSYTCGAGETPPSARAKAQWAKQTIEAANIYGISWHYWGFAKVGGFEAYDRANEAWYEGFPAAFGL